MVMLGFASPLGGGQIRNADLGGGHLLSNSFSVSMICQAIAAGSRNTSAFQKRKI